MSIDYLFDLVCDLMYANYRVIFICLAMYNISRNSKIDDVLSAEIDRDVATPQLQFVSQEGSQTICLNDLSSWTLGRNQNNVICLEDAHSSRFHARIDVIKGRYCYFSDLNSSNGSHINWQYINEPVLLKHGDRIQTGSMVFEFQHNILKASEEEDLCGSSHVLMLQTSSFQGKIWQEILMSQGVLTLWGAHGKVLNEAISVNTVSHPAPKVLLIDISVYRKQFVSFCKWMACYHPEIQIVFFDRTNKFEYANKLPKHVCRIPALPECDFLKKVDYFSAVVKSFLRIYDESLFNLSQLEKSLGELDEIFQALPSLQQESAPFGMSDIQEDYTEIVVS